MFGAGTSVLGAEAALLVRSVAQAVAPTPNQLTVRGHTDSIGYARGGGSNWSLSTARADATRRALVDAGVPESRFRRIEGVADTDPYNPADRTDPRNRRISITVLNAGAN
nr:OmpA family protein [Polymorphobacter fuscus]